MKHIKETDILNTIGVNSDGINIDKEIVSEGYIGDTTGAQEIIPVDIKERKYYSRELSWIKFNKRVLDLANSEHTPLFEKLKFLEISSNNLDEFIMVRCGKLINNIEDNSDTSIDGLSPAKELKAVYKEIKEFNILQNETYTRLAEELKANNIEIIMSYKDLDPKEKGECNSYFSSKIYSMLTPIVFDNSRPFPKIKNRSMNMGVLLEDERTLTRLTSTIYIPDILPRFVKIKGTNKFIALEAIIKHNLKHLFINKKIIDSCTYRILRNSYDLIHKEESEFITDIMENRLKDRETGQPILLEITDTKKELIKIIEKGIKSDKRTERKIINENCLFDLSNLSGINCTDSKLKYKEFEPAIGDDLLSEYDIFKAIDKRDILLQHPYDSYQPIVDFINQAADNPDVVSIKQTLYRVSHDSPIVNALIRAAEKGKQVTVLLEVRARFNEQENLNWAKRLTDVNGYVVYGVDNMKTHCKMCLITKKTKKGNLDNYVHLGTGNYNDKTARIYTDLSLFTSSKAICNDVIKMFNTLYGFSEPRLKNIVSSPHNLRNKIYDLIDNEIKAKKEGKDARIIMKMNTLSDKGVIDKIYDAADAGVKIDLIVRGACSLVTNESYKNINVISIVGRYLEHSRIYYFKNNEAMYIASADMMARNLDRRFEIMAPVTSKHNKEKLSNILDKYLKDTTKYTLHDTNYVQDNIYDERYSIQEEFSNDAIELNKYKNVDKIYIR